MQRLLPISIPLVFVLAAGGGCGSNTLSRDEAARLIAESDEFNVAVKKEILLGQDARRGMGGFLNSLTATFDYELADCLVGMEYLEKGPQGYALTAKGQAEEEEWEKDPSRPNGRLVPVAHTELVEVSGISQAEGSAEADGEFKWRWKWDPIMDGMDNTEIGADCQVSKAREFGYNYVDRTFEMTTGKAKFRRYDDGWRLESLTVR